jgi:hypothetical protein
MVHVRPEWVVASALAASDAGVPDAENAARHGVVIKTIRRWRRLYQRRGLQRGQAHTTATCPRCDGADLDAAAYGELLGWYLGDGHITAGRRGVWNLHIYNDLRLPRSMRTSSSSCVWSQHAPGRKHERRTALETWQEEIVTSHPGDFLALDLAGVAWRRSKPTTVSVSRRNDVRRLDALIRPEC